MGFLATIAASIVEKLLTKLGAFLFKKGKRILKDREIDEEVDKEVAAVKKAKKDADKALKECDETEAKSCKISPKQEKRLRDATRRLSNNIFD